MNIDKNICIVCGHKLDCHIDEDIVWRCHSLGCDFSQCECIIRKDRANGKINYYDLRKRVLYMKKELKSEIIGEVGK